MTDQRTAQQTRQGVESQKPSSSSPTTLFCLFSFSPPLFFYVPREKRALLSSQLTGEEYIKTKRVLDASSANNEMEVERLHVNNLASTTQARHEAVSFVFPTSYKPEINFREENRVFTDFDTGIHFPKPFSYLSS